MQIIVTVFILVALAIVVLCDDVCLSERASGCTNDEDCCVGFCTAFPWGRQCRLAPLYKEPSAQPTAKPHFAPTDLPTAVPTSQPSETAVPTHTPRPSALPTTATPTTAIPTALPTTAQPSTAAPTTTYVTISRGYLATKGNQIVNELNEPVVREFCVLTFSSLSRITPFSSLLFVSASPLLLLFYFSFLSHLFLSHLLLSFLKASLLF